jgi:hypothetical protein
MSLLSTRFGRTTFLRLTSALELTANPNPATIIDLSPTEDPILARVLGNKRIRRKSGWMKTS